MLFWFRSYLQGRKQAVKIGIKTAQPVECSRGVPQGSVLGPVLYSIYVRSVPKILSSVATIQYADDICFYVTGKQVEPLADVLSIALDKLNSYLADRSLLLNASKTQVMLISSSRSTPSRLQVNLDGKPIEQVHCAKYLGLLIDSHLTFSHQVEKVARKVAGLTGALRRYRRKLDIKSRRMFYIALIQPHLEYASNAYVSLLTSSNMNILRVAANSAVRAIYGLPAWTHVTSLYTRLHIANIDQRYFLKSLITAFKCITHAAPTLLAERFSINTRPSNSTRQTTTRTFKLPNVARQIGLHSPSFLFADRFNGLQAVGLATKCSHFFRIFDHFWEKSNFSHYRPDFVKKFAFFRDFVRDRQFLQVFGVHTYVFRFYDVGNDQATETDMRMQSEE